MWAVYWKTKINSYLKRNRNYNPILFKAIIAYILEKFAYID